MKYNDIEFFTSPEGEILIRKAGEPLTEMHEGDDLITDCFEKIRKDYPEAFMALSVAYRSSEKNFTYFRYLCVRRFIRCNFAAYDTMKEDIDNNGQFNFEQVMCPMRGECHGYNIICNPKFNTSLSPREEQILKLYGLQNMEMLQISEELFLSPFTVETTIKNIRRKLNIHDKSGLAHYCVQHFKK